MSKRKCASSASAPEHGTNLKRVRLSAPATNCNCPHICDLTKKQSIDKLYGVRLQPEECGVRKRARRDQKPHARLNTGTPYGTNNIDKHDEARLRQWLESIPSTPEPPLDYCTMTEASQQKRGRSLTSGSESIRSGSPSSSQHRRSLMNRMGLCGIMSQENNRLNEEELQICQKYLKGKLKPGRCLMYPDTISSVIRETGMKPEIFVHRDIMPWVAPSMYTLVKSKECDMEEELFEEQMDGLWTDCQTMGSTTPKPDYVAGFSAAAFSRTQLATIDSLHTDGKVVHVSPGLFLPFLVVEAKSGLVGLVEAEIQNLHAGGILVRAMFELFKAAYQISEAERLSSLSGKPILWSYDLNHDFVNIHVHFGILEDVSDATLQSLRIYRQRIASLRLEQETERFIPYNITREVYERFAPDHLTRIRNALDQIEANSQRTDLRFAASSINLKDLKHNNPSNTPETPPGSTTAGNSESLMSSTLVKQQLTMLTSRLEEQEQRHREELQDWGQRNRELLEWKQQAQEELQKLKQQAQEELQDREQRAA